jgi:hypothetical protein
MATHEHLLTTYIRKMADIHRDMVKEQTGKKTAVVFEDLLLQHGRFYAPHARPKGIRGGRPKQCFYNTFRIVNRLPHYRYAEGYALDLSAGLGPFPVAHGFVVDDEGAYECTLRQPAAAYFGVEFAAHALLDGAGTRAFSTVEDWLADNSAAVKRFNAARLKTKKTGA